MEKTPGKCANCAHRCERHRSHHGHFIRCAWFGKVVDASTTDYCISFKSNQPTPTMAGNKIVHVRMCDDGLDYYFGSLIAIYDILPPDRIGISYDSLVNTNKIRPGNPFVNDKCTIQVGELHRKKTNRKNPKMK